MQDTTGRNIISWVTCLVTLFVTHTATAAPLGETFALPGVHSFTGLSFTVNVDHRLLDMSSKPEQATIQRLVIKGLTLDIEQQEHGSEEQISFSYEMEGITLDICPLGGESKQGLSPMAKAKGKFHVGNYHVVDRSAFEFIVTPRTEVVDEAVDLERFLGTAFQFMAFAFPSTSPTGIVNGSSWQTGHENSNRYRFTLINIEQHAGSRTAVVKIELEVNENYFEIGYALIDNMGLTKLWVQQGMGIDERWKFWGITVLRNNVADIPRNENEKEFKVSHLWWERIKKRIQQGQKSGDSRRQGHPAE